EPRLTYTAALETAVSTYQREHLSSSISDSSNKLAQSAIGRCLTAVYTGSPTISVQVAPLPPSLSYSPAAHANLHLTSTPLSPSLFSSRTSNIEASVCHRAKDQQQVCQFTQNIRAQNFGQLLSDLSTRLNQVKSSVHEVLKETEAVKASLFDS
ncbi:unnamed protein product, partial [Protopolystoma xenopodis]